MAWRSGREAMRKCQHDGKCRTRIQIKALAPFATGSVGASPALTHLDDEHKRAHGTTSTALLLLLARTLSIPLMRFASGVKVRLLGIGVALCDLLRCLRRLLLLLLLRWNVRLQDDRLGID